MTTKKRVFTPSELEYNELFVQALIEIIGERAGRAVTITEIIRVAFPEKTAYSVGSLASRINKLEQFLDTGEIVLICEKWKIAPSDVCNYVDAEIRKRKREQGSKARKSKIEPIH